MGPELGHSNGLQGLSLTIQLTASVLVLPPFQPSQCWSFFQSDLTTVDLVCMTLTG